MQGLAPSQGRRLAAAGCSGRHRRVALKAQKPQLDAKPSKMVNICLSAGLAASLSLLGVSPAIADVLAERRQAQEAAVLEQMRKMEYALQLQENARKAELLARQQTLDNQVEQIETAIQRKLIEESANEQAAAKKGEQDRAARIQQEQEQVKQQELAVQVAAAKAEANLKRAELLEKAKEVEKKQQVEASAVSVMDLLGLKQEDLGL